MDLRVQQVGVLICVLLCDLNQVSSPLWAPNSSSVKWINNLISHRVHLSAIREIVRGTYSGLNRYFKNEIWCHYYSLVLSPIRLSGSLSSTGPNITWVVMVLCSSCILLEDAEIFFQPAKQTSPCPFQPPILQLLDHASLPLGQWSANLFFKEVNSK